MIFPKHNFLNTHYEAVRIFISLNLHNNDAKRLILSYPTDEKT